MRALGFIFLCFTFVTLSYSQQLVEKYLIDDFAVLQECVVNLPNDLSSQDPPVVLTTFATGSTSSIIGGERDMEMRVFSGFQGRRFASQVFELIGDENFIGKWAIENPKISSSAATNQYDGVDQSFNVNFNGLNVDLTDVTQMTMYVIFDLSSVVEINFFDSNGNSCTTSQLVQGTLTFDFIKTSIELSSLVGNCNQASIGAIEIIIETSEPLDGIITRITLDGPLPPNVSPTPTPTPTPTASFVPQLVEKYLIDDFEVVQECVITLQNDVSAQDPPVVQTTFATGSTSSVIGGERDMELRVFSGFQGRRLASHVLERNGDANFNGEWAIEGAKSSSMSATNQYDGVDQSFNVNFNGLNVDLTDVTQMTMYVIFDLSSVVEINFFDFNGNSCTTSQLVPGTLAFGLTKTSIQLSSLVGNCNQASIGAIEIIIETSDALDAIITRITLDGPLPPNVSPTPTPTPTPSAPPPLVEKYLIDDFEVVQECVITLQNDVSAQDPPVVQTTVATGSTSSIIGGERDMELRVFSGFQGRILASHVLERNGDANFNGEWAIEGVKSSSMSATNQYDGVDQSFNVNFNGLNVDLTDVTEMTMYVIFDLSSVVEINFFDFNGNSCTTSHLVPGTLAFGLTKTSIQLSSLVGNCNQASIGAIEIIIETSDALDAIITRITLDGPLPPNVSPTPTPTPTPSAPPPLVEKYLIDDFEVVQECVVTLQNDVSAQDPPVVQTTVATGSTSSIIGGERDMELRVFSGFQGRRFASHVLERNGDANFNGEWAIEGVKSSSMSATNQYDGVDQSFNVNFNGLNVDLTDVTQMTMYVIFDLSSVVEINFFDFNGNSCTTSHLVPGTLAVDLTKTSIQLSSLVGNCNQASIGAIEIIIETSDALDAIITRITLDGPLPPNVSPTPTPTPTPTASFVPQLVEKYLIDDFAVLQECVVNLPNDLSSQDPPVVQTTFATGSTSSIIGGERDMEMRVFSGFQGRRFASQVFELIGDENFIGKWAIENPKTSSSAATNQYDGVDQSFNVNFNGLNVDLTDVTQMTMYVIFDLSSVVEINFFDSNGNSCTTSKLVQGTLTFDFIKTSIELSSLVGNCNQASIGAIEIIIETSDALDAIITRITLDGPVPSNVSPTPSSPSTSPSTSSPPSSPTSSPTSSRLGTESATPTITPAQNYNSNKNTSSNYFYSNNRKNQDQSL